MNPRDILRELAYPFTDLTVLLALAVFAVLFVIAGAAGWMGIWLGIILLVAFNRYLLLLLEARANGKAAPVAAAELFDIADNFWSLTPLVLYAIAILGVIGLKYVSLPAAQIFALAIAGVLPASLAVLSVTRSPFESLNPAVMWRMMRVCGADYLLIPVVVALGGVLASYLAWAGMPAIVIRVVALYPAFLLFTFTGAVLNANGVTFMIEIPEPVEPDEDAVAAVHERGRKQVLTHAYGFFSRGNPAGGRAHILNAIRAASNPDETWRWFFEKMLEWESTDAALSIAQYHLSELLRKNRDLDSLKLMTRCLYIDPAFKPLQGDRAAARELAERFAREDILRSLARTIHESP